MLHHFLKHIFCHFVFIWKLSTKVILPIKLSKWMFAGPRVPLSSMVDIAFREQCKLRSLPCGWKKMKVDGSSVGRGHPNGDLSNQPSKWRHPTIDPFTRKALSAISSTKVASICKHPLWHPSISKHPSSSLIHWSCFYLHQ